MKMKNLHQKCKKVKSEDGFKHEDRTLLLRGIYLSRLICLCGWIGGMMYGTWQIFIAAEELLSLQRSTKLNPSVFSAILGRGRDNTDVEWDMFTTVFTKYLLYCYILYAFLSKVSPSINPKIRIHLSTIMSIILLQKLIGILPTMFLLGQPLLYWLMMKLRSKLLIWAYTLGMLININNIFPLEDVIDEPAEDVSFSRNFFFVTIASWNFSRCMSYVFDIWNRPRNETNSLSSLLVGVSYCLYIPTLVTGPLILFDHYETHVYKKTSKDKSIESSWSTELRRFFKNLLRMILLSILMELILHYFYVRSLAFSTWAMKKVNFWVLCTSVYWIGQIFTVKYQVMYGIASVFAEFDGVPMPPLPRCPGYLHRYSVLWKDFDRGLYNFLIRYIYVPFVNSSKLLGPKNKINLEVNKFLASMVTFAYIYVWHSTHYSVFLWALFNFMGITFERIGSTIKRVIDTNWKLDALVWDVIVEPIVTVPLAAMSMLNSSIFCASLDVATIISTRLRNEMGVQDVGCLCLFMYFFTHFAVAYRTGSRFGYRIRIYEKNL